MATKTVHSQAPTRIDLAGGTMDIWPIYLFLKNPQTINLAIDLYAEAVMDDAGEPGITLESLDQNLKIHLIWGSFDEASLPEGLALHYKLLRYFVEKNPDPFLSSFKKGLRLSTSAQSPAGAGLGGSSSLSIAILGALARWVNYQENQNFIDIVRDVETTVIQIPAGLQDYYAAMHGGLQSLQWRPGVHERYVFSREIMKELENRLLLFYSGQSRNSGINNWSMFKSFIDRQGAIPLQFEKIAQASEHLGNALKNKNWQKVGEAILEEWEVRKTLAPHITTPLIDQAFSHASKIADAVGKVCGAGGGGCFFLYLQDPTEQNKSKILKEFSDLKIKPLSFSVSKQGLTVSEK